MSSSPTPSRRSASDESTAALIFVADAEALYSYDGTREINTLIVGRRITGISAFV